MEKQKKEASPSAWAAALGEEGFYKNQSKFFPECLGQALGDPKCNTRERVFFK
jgi:hypothetical protein